MSQLGTLALKSCLNVLHYSGAARLAAPFTRGAGAILMLHHVRPRTPSGFAPNGLLEIKPEFLDAVIRELQRQQYDFVTLSQARERLAAKATGRPFVALTFDDGYRDNRDYALPVLERHGVPATIYVASDFADGNGFLWWLVLERVIAASSSLSVTLDGRVETMACSTDREKQAAFDRIYWKLRSMPEDAARAIVARLAVESGLDPLAPCRELVMTWAELREIAAHPLIELGAHTLSHRALAKLPASEAQAEIAGSVRRLEAEIGKPCRHFSYPYGDASSAGEREFEIVRRLGLETSVTTRKGLIVGASSPDALPRVSLNGLYQRLPYVKALLSGLPFALLDTAARAKQARGYSPAAASGLCIQRTSQAAGTTQAIPPTT